jgi:O-antigen chain-terminating methyltransferase
VTGFHLVEHLSFEMLLALLDETHRVLKPGGIAIFETPNLQNVLVGSYSFYTDPTHRNPLPAGLMKFMLEMRGFSNVEVVYLHSYPEEFRVSGSDLADRFNDYFYGPQDYAVVGHRP